MPTVTHLTNQHMAAVYGVEKTQAQDSAEMIDVEVYTMTFSDRQSGNQIVIAFGREARDELVRQLTQGIVLAGGGLPNVIVPPGGRL